MTFLRLLGLTGLVWFALRGMAINWWRPEAQQLAIVAAAAGIVGVVYWLDELRVRTERIEARLGLDEKPASAEE